MLPFFNHSLAVFSFLHNRFFPKRWSSFLVYFYRYLGQVLDAEDRTQEAERSMRRGIELLRQEIAQMEDHPELAGSGGDEAAEEIADTREHLREALSSALCSLAELLMGSAADEADEADEEGDAFQELLAASPALLECESLLQEAKSLWPRSPEPLQALSSLRHLQGQDDLALDLLRQSLSLWHIPLPSGGGEERIENGEQGANEVDMVEDAGAGPEIAGTLPSYEFRFETAKLLLELDDSMEIAASVLEGLLEENDTVPDVWLLLAVAYRSGGELEAAAEAASEGASMARKLGLPADHEVVAALGELEMELSHMVVHAAAGVD